MDFHAAINTLITGDAYKSNGIKNKEVDNVTLTWVWAKHKHLFDTFFQPQIVITQPSTSDSSCWIDHHHHLKLKKSNFKCFPAWYTSEFYLLNKYFVITITDMKWRNKMRDVTEKFC